MIKSRLQQVMALSCVVLGASINGCSGNVYRYANVTGKVTCNGKPASGGIVVFQPKDAPKVTNRPKGQPGPSSSGIVSDDGTFTLIVPAMGTDSSKKGVALVGPHDISFILPPRSAAEKVERVEKQEDIDGGEVDVLVEPQDSATQEPPPDFSDIISPTSVEVKAGSNTFDFTLQPGAPAADSSSPRAIRRARRMYSQYQNK